MPRTEAQFEGIREQKTSLILHTALELFAHEGYYPTSISKIADKAGISKGLMYNYFPSKEELILAIIGKGIDKLNESLDPDHDGILTKEELEYYIHENFRILQENSDYWKLYFSTMMQPAVFKLVKAKFPHFLPPLQKVVEDYYKRLGIHEPEIEAVYFDAMLDGVFLNYVLDPDGFPLEKVKDLIIRKMKKMTVDS
jgi:AcrR family transcriptional regulator